MTRLRHSPSAVKSLGGVVNLQASQVPRDKELRVIAELVRCHSGIVYQPRNYTQLVRAVSNRIFKLGISDAQDYLNLLKRPGKPDELNQLTSLLTVQKTSFFRDRSQFELLEEMALPDILSRKPIDLPSLRVWSAGCSTGEEPFSIAISLLHRWPFKNVIHILATDISAYALGKAMLGSYRDVDLAPLAKSEKVFFHQKADQWHVTDNVCSMVDFQFHNLVSVPFPVPPQGLWDIIFCRNVLIYFNRETVREIIDRFSEVLAPKGYLFLGPSESLYRLVQGFDLVSTDKAFVYQKSDSEPAATSSTLDSATCSRYQPGRPKPSSQLQATSTPLTKPKADIEAAISEAKRLLESKDSDTAFNYIFKITKQHPEALAPYVMLGKMAADRGSLEEALSWFHVAAKMDPLSIESRFLLAVVQHRLGRDQEAAEELRKVLFLDGHFILGHYYLGVVANHMGNDEMAHRSFRNVLRSADVPIDKEVNNILTTLQLTMDMLATASRAHLKQLENKRGRKRSNKR